MARRSVSSDPPDHSLTREILITNTWDQEFLIMRSLQDVLEEKVDTCPICFSYTHDEENCTGKPHCSRCGNVHKVNVRCLPMCRHCYSLGVSQGHFECPARYKAIKMAFLKQIGVPRDEMALVVHDITQMTQYLQKYKARKK